MSRSGRKRRAILDAATTVFLTKGYLGASMDEIAAAAGVSKSTVYQHFSDKRRLFVAIVTSTVDESSDPVLQEVIEVANSEDIEPDLRDLARRQLERVLQPTLIRLRRLVIGEVSRFPELARTFYLRGAGRTTEALATTFERLVARGVLQMDNPALAASQFNWLIMSEPINRAMLLGEDGPPSSELLDRYARDGVGTFLAAYGRR